MRLAVYTDYSYRRKDGRLFGERAFVLFLNKLAEHFDRLVVPGRLDPSEGRTHYPLSDRVELVPLPHYRSVAEPLSAGWAMARSLRTFWQLLDRVDAVWLLGPHPLVPLLALLAAARGRGVALGVRQNTPAYVRARRPGRRLLHLVADLLEASNRLLARRCPTVVVGPELAHNYRHAPRLLEIAVSLVPAAQLVEPERALERDYGGELRALSVGRLETEKNPLLLADVLERLDSRWRLLVCGEGPMADELAERFAALGLSDRCELVGYLALDAGLLDLYRSSHALLHVSWTEGLPQVLFEAFGAGLPVVATAVGGVADAVGDAALLVAPGDPDDPAKALARVAEDPVTRERLIRAGHERVQARTLESEATRVADFLASAAREPRG